MPLLDDLDRRRELEMRDRENSARLAQAYAEFITTRSGTMQYEDRVDFGTTFVERPYVAYGCRVDTEQVADSFGAENDEDVMLPLCTGYVTEWDEDERGFYIGCWLAVRVYYPYEDLSGGEVELENPAVEIEHHFTFAGIAMKDIPVDKRDAL